MAEQMILATSSTTLLPTVLEPVIMTPGDGARYQIVSSLVRSEPITRFFAIARGDDAVMGDMFVLEPEIPFVTYIDRMAEWHDLELLWAGWRAFLFLCGRPNHEAPWDLPRWRSDWYAPLTTVPNATYQMSGAHGSAHITIRRASPKAFSAHLADTAGRPLAEVLGCASVEAALDSAQGWLKGQ